MNTTSPYRQRGAVLLIALVMLLVLTILAVSAMRGVAMESRLTGNRAFTAQLQNSAEAAVREAEFRFFDPSYLRDKLEPKATNCATTNVLKANGANKPCLLAVKDDQIRTFRLNPAALLESAKSTFLQPTSTSGLAWMPYRGLDAGTPSEQIVTTPVRPSKWNAYLISGGAEDTDPLNVEYGDAPTGKGTYFYLINGQTDTAFTVQTTIANVYLGLNN